MPNDNLMNLTELDALNKIYEETKINDENSSNDFWNSLSYKDKCNAFHYVVSKIVEGEINKNASYRNILYDIFGFDIEMYGRAQDCGFMNLHNSIYKKDDLIKPKDVNRFEVIDEQGRAYVKYLSDNQKLTFSMQDNDKTIKVFIDKK